MQLLQTHHRTNLRRAVIGRPWALMLALGGALSITSCTTPMPNGHAFHDQSRETATTRPPTQRPLDGTAWRLVGIASMDNRVFTPDQRSQYTLAFEGDGNVFVRADCNRGKGAWSFTEPNRLTFGPLATTRAKCPPGSLHNRFIANLADVRSFVIKDGRLWLTTMADGATLEFEPLAP